MTAEKFDARASMVADMLESMIMLHVLEIKRAGFLTDWRDLNGLADKIAEQSDLLFGETTRQQHRDRGTLMAEIAYAVAVLSFLPGGVSLFDRRYANTLTDVKESKTNE